MRKMFYTPILLVACFFSRAQELHSRAMTMEEYQKAKQFSIKDLDRDTYVKFDNAYILDRYEMRKPYFITGDDGLKKRIDLYTLIAKDSLQELGLVIFYTTETGKRYEVCMPGFKSDGKVWEQYFEDIDAINKEEKHFVLKLSYVLSKEMGFQLYKALNQGKDLKEESATYGNEICFPGNEEVAMADGSRKYMKDVLAGDRIVTVDPATGRSHAQTVTRLVTHPARNYALTRLTLTAATETETAAGIFVRLSHKILEATPNHPMYTKKGKQKLGAIRENDRILCFDPVSHRYRSYIVTGKETITRGARPVYNLEVSGGSTYVINGVMASQK